MRRWIAVLLAVAACVTACGPTGHGRRGTSRQGTHGNGGFGSGGQGTASGGHSSRPEPYARESSPSVSPTPTRTAARPARRDDRARPRALPHRKVTATPRPTRTQKGCGGTPIYLNGEKLPEVRGTARDAELWGLLFARRLPIRHGDEVKIVWRMTGEGPLTVVARRRDGTPARVVFGPEEHSGSSWQRPGQEWGTGFTFPKAGCWKIELTRTRGSGYVWLSVR